jgi:hypothetical protein
MFVQAVIAFDHVSLADLLQPAKLKFEHTALTPESQDVQHRPSR